MGDSESLAFLVFPIIIIPFAIAIRIEMNKLGKRITELESQIRIQDEINRHHAKEKQLVE